MAVATSRRQQVDRRGTSRPPSESLCPVAGWRGSRGAASLLAMGRMWNESGISSQVDSACVALVRLAENVTRFHLHFCRKPLRIPFPKTNSAQRYLWERTAGDEFKLV